MSRIGENPINIPEGVDVSFVDSIITVKGSKGELTQDIKDGDRSEEDDNQEDINENDSKEIK